MARRPRRPMSYRQVLAVMVVVIAAMLAFGGVLVSEALGERAASEPIAGGLVTTGTITTVVPNCGRHGCTYRPVISFRAGGTGHEFTGNVRDVEPDTGSVVRVSYDPADPARAHDLSFSPVRYVTELVLGAVFLAAGLVLAVMFPRNARRLRLRRASAAVSQPIA